MQEVVGKVFLLLELPGDQVVVTVEPLVADLDRLNGIHLHEVSNVLLNKLVMVMMMARVPTGQPVG